MGNSNSVAFLMDATVATLIATQAMLLELEGAEDGGDDMFLAVEEDDENGAASRERRRRRRHGHLANPRKR